MLSFKSHYPQPAIELLRLQGEALQIKPSEHVAWRELNETLIEVRTQMIQAADSLSAQIGLIGLDFSFGRLGPVDLRRINGELRSLLLRTGYFP